MKYLVMIALLAIPVLAAKKEISMSNFKKPSKEELKKKLSPLQYSVTQEDDTERPFKNEYWDNHADGIYVDIVSGEPLFSSQDKFDSGTGWPSFTKPLEKENITEHTDTTLFFQKRTEVRSKHADSHLGHVFPDGPPPTGLRYCMNSASMRFIAKENLDKEGYSQYKKLFATAPAKTRHATLAGGCFWGVEELLRKLPGVVNTVVGYTGGFLENPTYEDVKKGNTGHAESIDVEFDPSRISYEEILKYFFKLHDPTTKNRQGNDVGTQYRSAIFYQDEEQKKVALTVMDDAAQKWKKPLTTELVKAAKFYPAEEYHQDYLQKNPGGYTCHYVRNF